MQENDKKLFLGSSGRTQRIEKSLSNRFIIAFACQPDGS